MSKKPWQLGGKRLARPWPGETLTLDTRGRVKLNYKAALMNGELDRYLEGAHKLTEHMKKDQTEDSYHRRVVCAANLFDDGTLVVGARHFDSVMRATINLLNKDLYKQACVQGFIDQHGVFMTREEARRVAEAAGQIMRRVGGDDDRLYSENLY